MTGEKKDHKDDDKLINGLSRRDFVVLSLGWLAAAAGSMSGTELPVIETDVDFKTSDGVCDAVFMHPTEGSHPGVLLWHDSPGLRPVIRELGKRIAAEGYAVLVPNLFYRARKGSRVRRILRLCQ